MTTTEYDPTTLKRVPNHDAARRQKELDAVLASLNQGNAQVGQPGDAPGATETQPVGTGSSPDPTNFSAPTVIELPAASTPPPPAPAVEPSPTVTAEEYAKLQKQYREACQPYPRHAAKCCPGARLEDGTGNHQEPTG